ncbi:aminotransferase class V-fold PLP-dependent enzyme [Desulfosporosinus sp. Sb-LF]|uniref:aminotransferase class V-fold PLP-dependent enzyme n=1 Tax=Desulfosporosinus sp. Sb-LF TaxID=2560027 RepID=UPI00107F4A92|nr:aminotransferase class V-fold PLP-dependent enzyme [Desulfosporosinus sp. Sb-LF]TGE32411.1 aminotransferase class V-fold PLP-dependent enzyme [Desulfosporosinus sp. Sb-LF]
MNYKLSRSNYRQLVVGTDTKIPLFNGQFTTGINFDNAASTPPFVSVMEEINNFSSMYSSIHRGTGYKSQMSSQLFEEARSVVLKFVNADPRQDTVIFVKNTTEAINKLSHRLWEGGKKSVILSTWMEHHSNDLPWRNKFQVDYVQTDSYGKLSLKDLESKLIKYKGKVKLVTVTGASNVTGYVNPIHKIAELAHRYQAKILVDGAQMVPHTAINMKPNNPLEHIDYLAFSAHKMYAPFGIGVLIGPHETFKQGVSEFVGGGTAEVVTHDWVKWNDSPHKDEAGSPNVMGVVALVAAIKTLTAIGMKNIDQYEHQLADYAHSRLKSIPGITLYSQFFPGEPRIGVIPFNINGMPHERVASILSNEAGIAVRTGCFCTQPYIQKLLSISPKQMEFYKRSVNAPRPGIVRLSFGLYNDFNEINVLTQMLERIIRHPTTYIY